MTPIEELAKEIHDAQEILAAYVRMHPHAEKYGMPLKSIELEALKVVLRCAIVPRETWNTMVTSFEEGTQLREHLRSFIGVH